MYLYTVLVPKEVGNILINMILKLNHAALLGKARLFDQLKTQFNHWVVLYSIILSR